ncbi:MAG: hypothetical protein CMJ58_27055 [Planctomycetaceae bacterium]|nr:hypothetical protein [Planctomycetaceae bacterium]
MTSTPARRLHLVAALTAGMAVLSLADPATAKQAWEIKSPGGRLTLQVEQGDGLQYSVSMGGNPILLPSRIDLSYAGRGWLARRGLAVTHAVESHQETVDFPVPRKFRRLETRYTQLTLDFGAEARLAFRVYDEGIAYRWETRLPDDLQIDDELTEFLFPQATRAWFPEEESIYSHQERVYKDVALTEVSAEQFCSTGVLAAQAGGVKVYVSESDLRSYPGMFLRGAGDGRAGLVGKFAGYPLEVEQRSDRDFPVVKHADFLAKTAGTRSFPWRLLVVADQDKDLLESELVYQLAAPLAIDSTDWIQPGKVSWDWWNGIDLRGVDFRAGVNTATYKYFVDFAAEYGIEYILLDEGWSVSSTDLSASRPEIDLREIIDHANDKGVRVLLWVLWNALDDDMEALLGRFEELGVAGIKVDFMQRDDQQMVDFYWRCARVAAEHKLLVDFHGAHKPAGLRRAYPNVMTYEGVNGLEQYKWSKDRTNPEQELILPFVRMVAGPLDYTPGAMRNANEANWRWIVDHPMSLGTRCHQLAMYVIYESPLQMLADSPTTYRREPECMRFLSAVPTVWDETVALDAHVGEYVAIARRTGDAWFVGAMTDWQARELEIPLEFLPEGEFQLQVWRDGANADRNGEDFAIETQIVKRGDTVSLKLAPAGGWVGWLQPTTAAGDDAPTR